MEQRRGAGETAGWWAGLDAWFDHLPRTLERKSRQLRENLALRYSTSGDPEGVLAEPSSHPVLVQPLWLRDDLGEAPDAGRDAPLYRAGLFALAITFLAAELRDDGSFIDASDGELLQELIRAELTEYRQLTLGSAFWQVHGDRWRRYTSAVTDTDVSPRTIADRIAPFGLNLAAQACSLGRQADLADLAQLSDDLALVHAIRQDLLAIRADVGRGVLSPTVQLMAMHAELPEFERPGRLLGAVLTGRAVDHIGSLWKGALTRLRTVTSDLGLPTFAAHVEDAESSLESICSALRLEGGASPPVRFRAASAPVSEAITMAERFLLADRSMAEAWEVHRWGMLGAPQVVARFPSALVLEVLARRGLDLQSEIDAFFRDAITSGFAYYDHPDLPYRETDTLGALFRLYGFSSRGRSHRRAIDEMWSSVEAAMQQGHPIPVWLAQASGPDEPMLLGEGCGSIQANLLLGLLSYDPHRFASILDDQVPLLLDRIASHRTAMSINYPPEFLLVVLARLSAALDGAGRADAAEHLGRLVDAELSRLAERAMSPMAAALSIAAFRLRGLVPPARWSPVILRAQAADGGWPGEPLFFVPSRGERVTWHASRLLTSAFCFEALHLGAG